MKHYKTAVTPQQEKRRGAIIVLAAVALVMIFAFAAFTVDLGFISVTKNQAQNAADSASRAAVLSLQDGLGAGSTMTLAEAEVAARDSAVSMMSKHRSGDLESTPVDGARDVRFGQRYIDPDTGAWVEQWGVSPYNMVEVTVRRMKEHDSEVPLFFAPILGHNDADLTATSVAATYPGAGFQIPAGSNDKVHILPFAIDLQTWTDYMTDYSNNYSLNRPLDSDMMMASSRNNIFSTTLTDGVFLLPQNGGGSDDWTQQTFADNYSYDEVTKTVCDGNDNIPELNIYPDLDTQLPPGNRGMVDMGSPNNSTADVKRQIEEGLNAYDFSFFPNNEIRTDQGPIYLNGDTGISAGIQNSLEMVVGKESAIPIFTEVTGNGNNAMYTVVKFVGVRLMHSKLSGGPNKRHVLIQPAPFYSTTVIRGTGMPYADSLLTQPINIR